MFPALVVLALSLVGAAPTWGYVRTLTTGKDKDGKMIHARVPTYWNHPIIPVVAQVGSPPAPLTADQIMRATKAAADAWSRPATTCSQIEIRVRAEANSDGLTTSDLVNNIIFRGDSWCKKPPRPAPAPPCYDPGMLAVTTLYQRVSDGRILEADIEVNAVSADWSDVVADPESVNFTQDLQGALTHEFGHLLGFDHSCLLPGDEGRTDDMGRLSPSCSLANDPAASVMVASVQPGQHIPRTLSDDDVRGLCEIYPTVGRSIPGDHVGCSIAPSDPRGRPPATATFLAGLVCLSTLSAAARRRWTRRATARR